MKNCILSCVLCFGVLIGCSAKDENIADAPLPELYGKAVGFYENKNYKKSIEFFQAVERQYPYDQWTIRAQLMIGYLQYLKRDYLDAINSFKLFVELNPYHAEVPYALYMLGMSHYQQLSIIQRDQSAAKEGLEYFDMIQVGYPGSIYASDAQLKIKIIQDHLAGKHVDIARFYLKNRSYDAAISRLLEAITVFPNAEHIPEAKWRLVEAYEHLGLQAQARAMAQNLLKNHPKTTWGDHAKRFVNGS
ncbi:MAG: outer membrane protein assembly factor BamD [Pseudomonadota bacterium]